MFEEEVCQTTKEMEKWKLENLKLLVYSRSLRMAYTVHTSGIASTPTKTHLTTPCSTNASSRSKLLGMLGEVRPFVMRECCMKVYFYPDGDIFQWVQESRDIFVENFIKQELLSMVDLSIK